MTLAAIYNTFDGEELLEGSIAQIIDHVDEVLIVYQLESNIGEHYPELLATLAHIKERWPHVRLRKYLPDLGQSPARNERHKRQIGLDWAQRLECTHYLFIDNDEYYEPQQFALAKAKLTNAKADTSACRLYTYYQKPTYRLEPREDYWVPFIGKLSPGIRAGGKFPVRVDPTRGVQPAGRCYLFAEDDLIMHHYSYIRQDIGRKLRNSSAALNFGNVPQMVEQFNQWKLGMPLVHFNGYGIKEVPEL
ncbi:hypothetical protein BH09BAC1_BH09BAC1_24350 [soil metagenome]